MQTLLPRGLLIFSHQMYVGKSLLYLYRPQFTLGHTVIIVNRATTSTYDALVLSLTIARTIRLQKQASRLNVTTGLLALLLRDGAPTLLCMVQIGLTKTVR